MGLGDILILAAVAAALVGALAFIFKNGGFSGGCGGDCAHCASRCSRAGDEKKP